MNTICMNISVLFPPLIEKQVSRADNEAAESEKHPVAFRKVKHNNTRAKAMGGEMSGDCFPSDHNVGRQNNGLKCVG